MTGLALPDEPMAALVAAIGRSREVVDSPLLALAEACIESTLAGGPRPSPTNELEADVIALLEQMLVDVANLDDATVRRADRHFAPGQLADLVTASYALEASTRLRIASALIGART